MKLYRVTRVLYGRQGKRWFYLPIRMKLKLVRWRIKHRRLSCIVRSTVTKEKYVIDGVDYRCLSQIKK